LHCLSPDEAAETLVDLANFRGGPDNISVVIAQVNGAVPAAPAVDSMGDSQPSQRWPTAPLWIAAGAFSAILAYCLVQNYWQGVIGGAVGLIAAVLAGLKLRGPESFLCPPIQSLGGPYGNGPYRKAKCTPNERVVAMFAEIAEKLREQSSKDNGQRPLDWQAFDVARTKATAAREKNDHAEAIRRYSEAIRTIMKQCRELNRTVDADQNAILPSHGDVRKAL
jgi:hypothetical protein